MNKTTINANPEWYWPIFNYLLFSLPYILCTGAEMVWMFAQLSGHGKKIQMIIFVEN
jgi:hypothetical protein